ncbi:MAG: hypothetical protein HRT77_07605 [Halioglobus sp.]|nr:hypothetical protein [Halioglobus sp.]
MEQGRPVRTRSLASSDTYVAFGAQELKQTVVWWYFSAIPPIIDAESDYDPVPVILVGPWDGSPSVALPTHPPANVDGVGRFGSGLAIAGTKIAIGAYETFT